MEAPAGQSLPPRAQLTQQQVQPRNKRLAYPRIWNAIFGALVSCIAAVVFTHSRFVENFTQQDSKNHVGSPMPSHSHVYSTIHESSLFQKFHFNMVGYLIIVIFVQALVFAVLYFGARQVARLAGMCCGGIFGSLLLKILSFTLTTFAFYFATRVGSKAFAYGHLRPVRSIRMLFDDAKTILDLHFESEEEVKDFLFIDLATIATLLLSSCSSVFIARLFPNPEPLYHFHEVLLDLTCHLAADYFGAEVWKSIVIFLICLVIISLKEITEPPKGPTEHDAAAAGVLENELTPMNQPPVDRVTREQGEDTESERRRHEEYVKQRNEEIGRALNSAGGSGGVEVDK